MAPITRSLSLVDETPTKRFRRASFDSVMRRSSTGSATSSSSGSSLWTPRGVVRATPPVAYRKLRFAVRGGRINRRRRMGRGGSRLQTRASAHGGHGSGIYQPGVRMGKKRLTAKTHRRVKVSKNLREKITKVINSKEIHGYFQKTSYDSMIMVNNDEQQAFDLPYLGQVATAGGTPSTTMLGHMFSPRQVFYAVARLYGQNTAGAYLQTTSPGFTDTIFDVANFKVEVYKQWFVQRFKNNTQKQWTMKIYDCRPRSNQNTVSPRAHWAQAMAQDANDRINPFSNVQTNIHVSPHVSPQWNRMWKAQITTVILEPGQVWERTVEGPQQVYDFSKFYVAGQYQEYQKMATHTFVVIHPDMESEGGTYGAAPVPPAFPVPVVTGKYAGRIGESNPTAYNIVVESVYHCKFILPEQAGFTLTAGTNLPAAGGRLDRRFYKYGFETDLPTGPLEHVADVRIDVQNPQLTVSG